jgi:serine/threonine protein phosphatase PrpC
LFVNAEKDFAVRQTQGARPLQEDACAFSEIVGEDGKPGGTVIVVADGMGGHSAGERASSLAVQTFIGTFRKTGGSVGARMSAGLTAANDAISDELKQDATLHGMGTTFLAVCLTPAGLEWISVGDSPLYLLRGATLRRLNEDHSLRPILKEMAERGELPPTSGGHSVSGNILRAALLGEEIEMIDQSSKPLSLDENDLVIVATDGIHTLNDREIVGTCADPRGLDASTLAAGLIRAVTAGGNPKQDNTTIAILKPPSAWDGFVLPL